MIYLMIKLGASLVVVCAAFGFVGTAFGQAAGLRGRPLKDQPASQGNRLNAQPIVLNALAKLKLSDEQKTKVREAVQANRKAAMDLRRGVTDGSISKEDGPKKQQALRTEYMKTIRAILTPDQAKQFEPLLREEVRKAQQAAAPKMGG